MLFINSKQSISQVQIDDKNNIATFIAPIDDTYVIAIQNMRQDLVEYKLSCKTTSKSGIIFDTQVQDTLGKNNILIGGNMISNIQPNINNNIQAVNEIEEENGLVKDDATANSYYKKTGKIDAIICNMNAVSQKTLDSILSDYIKNTNDIGMFFTAVDYLSQNTKDTIMIDYVKRKSDIGILFSAMPYLSQLAIDKIAKNYAETHDDPQMIATLKPYVSKGVL